MNFDFSALLVLLTFLSGIIWAVDAWIFAPRRKASEEITEPRDEKPGAVTKEPLLVEYARSFFPIFFIVLILRSFIVEPFRIPSASMMPTLLIGDFILVNKYDYGIRLPVIHTKIINNGKPQRGDVIVFRYPRDPSIPFIKRIIGVPGDHISYYDRTLYINDSPMKQVLRGRFKGQGAGTMMDGASLREELLGDVAHQILVDPNRYSGNFEVVVPKGKYFVLGDNRDNSKDSRYWGFVPDQNLVGHAFMIWMNWDWKNGGINPKRIGTII
ncbi:MAG: signal peptidase I [Gammaproteobacteria bacterium]